MRRQRLIVGRHAGGCATEAPHSHDGTDQRPREGANGVVLDDQRSQRLTRVGRAGTGDDSVGLGDGHQIDPLLDERTAALVLVRTVCVSRAASNTASLGHVDVVLQMDSDT